MPRTSLDTAAAEQFTGAGSASGHGHLRASLSRFAGNQASDADMVRDDPARFAFLPGNDAGQFFPPGRQAGNGP